MNDLNFEPGEHNTTADTCLIFSKEISVEIKFLQFSYTLIVSAIEEDKLSKRRGVRRDKQGPRRGSGRPTVRRWEEEEDP